MTKTVIPLMYIGKRFEDDKMRQVFLNPNGKEVRFRKVRYLEIGHTYNASDEGEDISIPFTPEEVETNLASEEQIREWEIQEVIAEEMARRKRASNRYSKDKELFRDLMPPLRKLMKGLCYTQTRALIEALISMSRSK